MNEKQSGKGAQNQGGGKKGGKKPTAQRQISVKSNLRQPPYNISDGDLIAFGIIDSDASVGMNRQQSITGQEFMSQQDLEFVKKASERSRAWEKQEGASGSGSKNTKRAEVGISIKIDNFDDDENDDNSGSDQEIEF